MRAVCSISRRLRKVEFFRLTGLTRPLPVRVPSVQYDGQEVRSWFDESDGWLNSNATDPMGTEPFAPRSDGAEIQYSRCDCSLAVEWCNCVR